MKINEKCPLYDLKKDKGMREDAIRYENAEGELQVALSSGLLR